MLNVQLLLLHKCLLAAGGSSQNLAMLGFGVLEGTGKEGG